MFVLNMWTILAYPVVNVTLKVAISKYCKQFLQKLETYRSNYKFVRKFHINAKVSLMGDSFKNGVWLVVFFLWWVPF